jgi:hypothetical protein
VLSKSGKLHPGLPSFFIFSFFSHWNFHFALVKSRESGSLDENSSGEWGRKEENGKEKLDPMEIMGRPSANQSRTWWQNCSQPPESTPNALDSPAVVAHRLHIVDRPDLRVWILSLSQTSTCPSRPPRPRLIPPSHPAVACAIAGPVLGLIHSYLCLPIAQQFGNHLSAKVSADSR